MDYLDNSEINYGTQDRASEILKKYKEAQNIKDYWKDKFEEA